MGMLMAQTGQLSQTLKIIVLAACGSVKAGGAALIAALCAPPPCERLVDNLTFCKAWSGLPGKVRAWSAAFIRGSEARLSRVPTCGKIALREHS